MRKEVKIMIEQAITINSGVRTHTFSKRTEVPAPQAGMEIVKFHGQGRLISARGEGEPVNKAGFTPTQEQELLQMEAERIESIRETLAQEMQS